jgi:hypothetical protein
MESTDKELLLPIENKEELNKGAKCDHLLQDSPLKILPFKI